MQKKLFLMLCMLWSLSVQAQHTESSLIIYRNSSTTLYLPCERVDSITFLHNEPITLMVHTLQDPLLVPITDIDSMKILSLPSFFHSIVQGRGWQITACGPNLTRRLFS